MKTWAYVVEHTSPSEVPEIERWFREPVVVEARGILEMNSEDPEFRRRHEMLMKDLQDQINDFELAEQRSRETDGKGGPQPSKQEVQFRWAMQKLQELNNERR